MQNNDDYKDILNYLTDKVERATLQLIRLQNLRDGLGRFQYLGRRKVQKRVDRLVEDATRHAKLLENMIVAYIADNFGEGVAAYGL